jgi:two-component system response regulator RpaA
MRLLLAEDEKELSRALVAILKHNNYSVDAVYNGNDAYDWALSDNYDGIILDVMMPEVDGFTVAQRIRQADGISETPILMLTALSQLNDKVNGFNIGVDDYLTKPFEIDELIVRVRALLKRTSQIPKSSAVRELLTYKEITLIPESYSVQINDKIQKLTPIEYDIFNILFQNHGNMVSGAKLLKDVWGYDPDDNVETIRVHIRHLRSKIDKISDGKQYIETIYGGGYKLNV